jgi:hypothetical protein
MPPERVWVLPLVVVGIWAAVANPISAASTAEVGKPAQSEGTAPPDSALNVSADSTQVRKASLLALPILLFGPETGLTGGATMLYSFYTSPVGPASSLPIAALYSQKGQYFLSSVPQIHLRGGAIRIVSEMGAGHWPDRFFGIGSDAMIDGREDFTGVYGYVRLPVQVRLGDYFIGPTYWGSTYSISEREVGGRLESGRVSGSSGGNASGLGLQAAWDGRDNVYEPTRGTFVELTALRHGRPFGGDFDYWQAMVDVRRFESLAWWRGVVIGLQGYGWAVDGATPFYLLPKLGGSRLLRGYYQGRYRDTAAVIAQSEVRVRLTDRWYATVYGGLGSVADGIANVARTSMRLAAGVGIRYRLNPEGMKLRLDVARGRDSTAFYFTFGEAF